MPPRNATIEDVEKVHSRVNELRNMLASHDSTNSGKFGQIETQINSLQVEVGKLDRRIGETNEVLAKQTRILGRVEDFLNEQAEKRKAGIWMKALTGLAVTLGIGGGGAGLIAALSGNAKAETPAPAANDTTTEAPAKEAP